MSISAKIFLRTKTRHKKDLILFINIGDVKLYKSIVLEMYEVLIFEKNEQVALTNKIKSDIKSEV